jgi:hypothetical protein
VTQLGESVVAGHAHPAAAVTLTLPEPPPDVYNLFPGVRVKLHGADRVTFAVAELAPNVAFTWTTVFVATAVVVGVKFAEVDVPGTVTVSGTVRFALFEVNPTIVPPVGACEVSVTVQVGAAGGVTVVGLQDRLLTVGCTMPTALPTAVVATESPAAVTPAPPLNGRFVDVFSVAGDKVNCTVATTPFWMTFVFRPYTAHLEEPLVLLQEIVLLAFVAAAPTPTLMAAMSAAE